MQRAGSDRRRFHRLIQRLFFHQFVSLPVTFGNFQTTFQRIIIGVDISHRRAGHKLMAALWAVAGSGWLDQFLPVVKVLIWSQALPASERTVPTLMPI